MSEARPRWERGAPRQGWQGVVSAVEGLGGTRIRAGQRDLGRDAGWKLGTWRLMHGLGPASASCVTTVVYLAHPGPAQRRLCDPRVVALWARLPPGYLGSTCAQVRYGLLLAACLRWAEGGRVQGTREKAPPRPAQPKGIREKRKVGKTLAQRSPLGCEKWQVRRDTGGLTGRLLHYLHLLDRLLAGRR